MRKFLNNSVCLALAFDFSLIFSCMYMYSESKQPSTRLFQLRQEDLVFLGRPKFLSHLMFLLFPYFAQLSLIKSLGQLPVLYSSRPLSSYFFFIIFFFTIIDLYFIDERFYILNWINKTKLRYKYCFLSFSLKIQSCSYLTKKYTLIL